MAWRFEKTALDGQCELFGVNIFDQEWKSTGERVLINDPCFQQSHVFHVWQAEIDGQLQRFAAGEFCNSVWGFYLEEEELNVGKGTY